MSGDDAKAPDEGAKNGTRWLSIVLALLAALAYEVGRRDVGDSRWMTAGSFGLVALLTMGGHLAARAWHRRRPISDQVGNVFVLSMAGLAVVAEAVGRSVWGVGHPLELLLIAVMRNAVLALGVLAFEHRYQRLCGILAVFVVVFSTALTTDPFFYALVVLFAVCGIWWLMGTHWETLRVNLLAETREVRPVRWLMAIPIAVVVALLLLPVVGMDAARAAFGLMPSSGGTGDTDPYARSGVGDGDQLVAGSEDIQSFAPIEDAPFMNSHKPSLYDVFNEAYGDPKPPKESARAIALPPEFLQELEERHLKTSKKANREFSTLRSRTGRRKRAVENIDHDALLFVKGRVPLHLRLEVFDIFDGINWHPEPTVDPLETQRLEIQHVNERPWLRVTPRMRIEDFQTTNSDHALKIANLKTDRIPLPPQAVGLHIDLVDKADMFAWAQPSIVRMTRKSLPALIVINTHARLIDPAELAEVNITPPIGRQKQYGVLPTSPDMQRVRSLAREWVAGLPNGWPRVEAIVERLRTEYTLDPEASVPDDVESSVLHFLFESKRGDDYQFASAAALLLRSLNYPTRLVGGFYADPDSYDERLRHTPVAPGDVHTWCEVLVGRNTWATVEATPGYEVLLPEPTWVQRAWAVVAVVAAFVRDQWLAVSVAVVSIVVVVWSRHRIVESICVLGWRLRPPRDARRAALRTMRLLEWRAARLGFARPAGITAADWYGRRLRFPNAGLSKDVLDAVRLAEWATFAPTSTVAPTEHEASLAACERVVRGLSLSRWRSAVETDSSGPAFRPSLRISFPRLTRRPLP